MDIDIETLVKSATSNLDLSKFKGDVVAVKYVEHEIGNVEPNGIGIQIINEHNKSNSAPSIKPKPKAKKNNNPTPYTIRYNNPNQQSRTQRLIYLMRCLQSLQWIEEPQNADDFLNLFDGKPRECNIKWTNTINQATIYYFLQQLLSQSYMSPPQKVAFISYYFFTEKCFS